MGIPGIYKELGPGERISLAKLSVSHLETTERPFRLAIDVSIWQFQIQSGEGGRNPALRTLYYRLLKLLSLGIRPLFVFDGPYKPKLKRNVKSSFNTACLDNFLTKQLLKRFNFPFHDAPAEAEAECALLQREGVVDAVLSEDVDTLMFGCTLTLRSWTPEAQRSGKSPTHVNMYTAEANKRKTGLDSNGMILVALMSGGDYNTEGIRGCGPKIACEAARAGFGHELCRLAKNDHLGWHEWRMRLQHELHTNEHGFFKQKNKSVNLPVDFPDQTVLNYYTHPTISSLETIWRLKDSIKWDLYIDTVQLRAFVAEAFNWTYLTGAKYFLKTFAPALLAYKLLERSTRNHCDDDDDLEAKASAEAQLITSVHGKRTHWNTDGCLELRVSYVPSSIVGLDLSLEVDYNPPDHPLVAHEEDDAKGSDEEEKSNVGSPSKQKGSSHYDPDLPEKIWVLETFVKIGTPLLIESWEEEMRDLKKFASRKAREKAASSFPNNPSRGAMDRFVRITKAIPEQKKVDVREIAPDSAVPFSRKSDATVNAVPLEIVDGNCVGSNRNRLEGAAAASKRQLSTSTKSVAEDFNTSTSADVQKTNPWTLSKRPSSTYGFKSPTRYSALGIYAPNDAESLEPRFKGSHRSTQLSRNKSKGVPPIAQVGETQRAEHSRKTSNCSTSSIDERNERIQSENITYRTGKRLEAANPSPKKKSSLVKTGGGDNSKTSLRNLSGQPGGAELIELDSEVEEVIERPHTTSRVNRRLDFVKLRKPPQYDSPPSFAKEVSAGDHAFISLRESLDGAWRDIESWQVDDARTVFTSVEVLDLTKN